MRIEQFGVDGGPDLQQDRIIRLPEIVHSHIPCRLKCTVLLFLPLAHFIFDKQDEIN
jgi:hypothetical protein